MIPIANSMIMMIKPDGSTPLTMTGFVMNVLIRSHPERSRRIIKNKL
ncbi:MAG: hypothetical protein Q7J16_09310 [Candidatus Cloacimonadales bacterium]|nr:hypothetical protein [Candidatus Cloacimonadales bacterium]